jgi:hypothetical protein
MYAQQAQNFEAERQAPEICIRAERRCGELLREMKDSGQRQNGSTPGPGRGKKGVVPHDTFSLGDLGISCDQSSKWRRLAEVPLEKFDQALCSEGPAPTTEGIINAFVLEQHPMPKIDLQALWTWGRLCEFERERVLRRDPVELLDLMTPSMRGDVVRILPRVLAWLKRLWPLDSCSTFAQISERERTG